MRHSKARVFILAGITWLFHMSSAWGSVGTRGGGHSSAAEFARIADHAITKISILRPVVVNGFRVDADRMRFVFERSKIFAVNRELKLNGRPVHAINDPKKLEIYFNRKAWGRLNLDQKTQLVIHEFWALSFPSLSDLNYSYSSQLAELIKSQAGEDLKIHCRLSVQNEGNPMDYEVLDESMTHVTKGLVVVDVLSKFKLLFLLKEAYLQIQLKTENQVTVMSSQQYVDRGLDFEAEVPFKLVVSGKSYNILKLMCESALSKTP